MNSFRFGKSWIINKELITKRYNLEEEKNEKQERRKQIFAIYKS